MGSTLSAEVNNIFACVGGSLSILGVICVFISFFCKQRLKSPLIRFVFYESIADLFPPISAFIAMSGSAAHPESAACYVDAIFRQFFYLASFMFNFLVAFNIFWILGLGKQPMSKCVEVIAVCTVWGIALLLLILCLAFHQLGPAVNWCWVKDQGWQFAVFYLPLFIVVLFDFVAFFFVLVRMVKSRKFGFSSKKNDRTKHSLRRVILYPILFCFIHFFRIANRCYQWANGGRPYPAFQIGHGLISPLQGFLNAVVYVNLTHYIFRWCCCCCRKKKALTEAEEFPDDMEANKGWVVTKGLAARHPTSPSFTPRPPGAEPRVPAPAQVELSARTGIPAHFLTQQSAPDLDGEQYDPDA